MGWDQATRHVETRVEIRRSGAVLGRLHRNLHCQYDSSHCWANLCLLAPAWSRAWVTRASRQVHCSRITQLGSGGSAAASGCVVLSTKRASGLAHSHRHVPTAPDKLVHDRPRAQSQRTNAAQASGPALTHNSASHANTKWEGHHGATHSHQCS